MKRGDYYFALLFETFGGTFVPDTIKLLDCAVRQVQNKLSAHEYDLTARSARSWKAYATQQLSVRLNKVAAWELGQAKGLGRRRRSRLARRWQRAREAHI